MCWQEAYNEVLVDASPRSWTWLLRASGIDRPCWSTHNHPNRSSSDIKIDNSAYRYTYRGTTALQRSIKPAHENQGAIPSISPPFPSAQTVSQSPQCLPKLVSPFPVRPAPPERILIRVLQATSSVEREDGPRMKTGPRSVPRLPLQAVHASGHSVG